MSTRDEVLAASRQAQQQEAAVGRMLADAADEVDAVIAPKKKPKQPQDHQAKQLPPAPADRIRMITWEGHEYSIDPRVMDDLVFMELLADMETKPYVVAKVVARLLGDEQWERFKADHADDDGRISSERVGQFFEALNEGMVQLGN